jgi:hypothetical protein
MNQITLYKNVDSFVKTVGSLTVLGLLEPKVLEVLRTNQITAQEGVPTLTLVHTSRAKAH